MYGELTFREKELLYEVHIHVIGQEIARIFDQFSLVIDHWQEEGKNRRENKFIGRGTMDKKRERHVKTTWKKRESHVKITWIKREIDSLGPPPPRRTITNK